MADDFLSMNDVSSAEIGALLDAADAYRAGRDHDKPLAGKCVVMLFEKASLRTKVSFDIAVHELGGHPIYLGRDEVNLDVRESIEDVAGVLERWASVIVARVYRHETLVRLAARSSVPVVNALSDVEHPCQAMADLLTIRARLGRLDGINVAYVGDANNCALSLGLGSTAMGARFAIASPHGYAFAEDALASISARGAAPFATDDPIAAVSGADVVYTDAWTSMGQEHEAAERREAFQGYQVDEALMAHANPGALFMHPMPAHYGEEAPAGMLDHPQSAAFDQAANRLPAQKAVVAASPDAARFALDGPDMNSSPESAAGPARGPAPSKPLVAIVGRPNVGKSSLFNALIGRRAAIVSEVSGTTRDRLTADVEYMGRRMLLADTGGLVPEPETEMEANVAAQVETALDGADVVVFVADARTGPTFADQNVAQRLRRSRKPVVHVVNKIDNTQQEALAADQYEVGLGADLLCVSALHRRGLDEVLERIVELLPDQEQPDDGPDARGLAHIAIVGRPNVGKSSLVNAILGRERSIVSEVPGTTRDALDTPFEFRGEGGVLIDTAGVRRRGAIVPGIERYSVLRAVRAVDRSDVAVLVLDAKELATDQDLHIAGQVMEAFKGAVVAVNKWDLVEGADAKIERDFRRVVLSRLRFFSSVPVVSTSALNETGIERLLETVFAVHHKRLEWVPQATLTRVVMGAIARHLPPSQATGSLKIYRVKQESVGPPVFVFYCNNPHRVHFSYERYLENTIREAFGYEGTHLKLEFRGKGKVHVIGQNRSKALVKRRPMEHPARGPRGKGR